MPAIRLVASLLGSIALSISPGVGAQETREAPTPSSRPFPFMGEDLARGLPGLMGAFGATAPSSGASPEDVDAMIDSLLTMLQMLKSTGMAGPGGALGNLFSSATAPGAAENCAGGLFDQMFEQAALGYFTEAPVAGEFEKLDRLERLADAVSQIGAGDPCLARNARLMKASVLALKGRLGEAEVIFTKDLPALNAESGGLALLGHAAHAGVMTLQRRDGEARALYEELLPRLENRFGVTSQVVLATSGALADIQMLQGDFDFALQGYEKISRKLAQSGRQDHPLACISSIERARAQLHLGKPSRAEPLLAQALDPASSACGGLLTPQHPWTAHALRLRGAVAIGRQDYDWASADLVAASDTLRDIYGDSNPKTAEAMLALAELRALRGDTDGAVELLDRLDDSMLSWLGGEIRGTAQLDARRRLVGGQTRFQEVALLVALANPEHAGAQHAAASAVLHYKGLQGEEEAALARLLRSDFVPATTRELAADVARLRTRLAALYNRTSSDPQPPNRDTSAQLTRQLEAAEAELARASGLFQQQLAVRRASVADIQRMLAQKPEPTVLVEFRRFRKRELGALESGNEPEHWAAVVIDGDRIRTVELLDTAQIDAYVRESSNDELVKTARDEAAQGGGRSASTLSAMQRALFELVIEPLGIDDYAHVVLAPDGALSLVPFGALRSDEHRYWIEHPSQTLEMVQSGRTLFASVVDEAPVAGLAAFGGIDYGRRVEDTEHAPHRLVQSSAKTLSKHATRSTLEGRSYADLGLSPLPETAAEIENIGALYAKRTGEPVAIYKGAEATEKRLMTLPAPPRVLHLATHGFYHADLASVGPHRPMVFSGVALAGANASGPAEADGVLHAIEAQNLNLGGTELVVLSACETGQGVIERGEGLHGLTRAFRIAGAHHVLVALRPVRDSDARIFSELFYEHWLAADRPSPESAFRRAARELIDDGDEIDWTAFSLFRG